MMWLFAIVYASGIFGAWLQHTMPRRLLRDVPMETIYEQIAHVREQLLDEADTVVADACGRLDVGDRGAGRRVASTGADALASVMRPVGGDADDTAPLREFYLERDASVRAGAEAPRIRWRTR